ncbi:hypothetical protein F0L17_14550 [Streptomyces sp. TRM43335]|uniref:Uncharacterized protein n=1 Tax=Streptomyces taklimakanensis TaxID=2569853 RepID=A0A6G2BDU9_9ACTN|nr:hypothetical protein [Streptomyces taklimakanensis]MTE20306.1 hypothetical protein [Streptomyces taklimakanensis]
MEQQPTPLRDVARNPDAYVRYLQDVQRVVLDLEHNLATLAREVRVHCRGTHVEGDRRYHAYLRARPVENALADALRNLTKTAKRLEEAGVRRREHDDKVKAVAAQRQQKALAAGPAAPQLKAVPGQGAPSASAPTSVYDLGKERSA